MRYKVREAISTVKEKYFLRLYFFQNVKENMNKAHHVPNKK